MIPIKTVMSTDLITVKADTPIFEALDLLAKHNISGLPVVDGDKHVVGILSEKDVLEILLDKTLDGHRTVSDYMTREVILFSEDDDAIKICKFFIRGHIRRVPIVKDEKLVGIVSRRDIVKLILEAKSKISNLRYV